MPTEIFSDRFFNLSNPSTPFVSIQFRTKVSTGNITDNNIWTDLTQPPSNLFQEAVIEDNIGIKKLNLTLIDKNFTTLESALTQTIFATKLSNKLTKVSESKVNAEAAENKTLNWEFKINNANMANIRVRFGYAEMPSDDVIDATDFGSDYEKRTETDYKVIRSPWIYFMITKFEQNLTESGLQVNIQGISVTTVFLDTVKVYKKNLMITADPVGILDYFGRMIDIASDGKITVEIEDRQELLDAITNEDNSRKQIRLNLGSGIREGVASSGLRTLRSLLKEILYKIPAKIYNENEQEEAQEASGDEMMRSSNAEVAFKLTYMIRENEDKTNTVVFYYPDPFKTRQPNIRTYIWREYGKSVVKSASIKSSMDLAALNMQTIITEKGEDGGPPKVELAAARTNSDTAEENTHLGHIEEVTESINNDGVGNAFVTHYEEIEGRRLSSPAQRIMQRLVADANNQVFTGTLELIGDPFFLFDSAFRGFEYLIRLLILKPDYIDEMGSFVGGELSYLSGNYFIGKIIHSINNSEYNTSLTVQRLPKKEGTPVGSAASSQASPPPTADPAPEPNPPIEENEELDNRRLQNRILDNFDHNEKGFRAVSVAAIEDDPSESNKLLNRANRLDELSEQLRNTDLNELDSFISSLNSSEKIASESKLTFNWAGTQVYP